MEAQEHLMFVVTTCVHKHVFVQLFDALVEGPMLLLRHPLLELRSCNVASNLLACKLARRRTSRSCDS